jgi:hypothetical protein
VRHGDPLPADGVWAATAAQIWWTVHHLPKMRLTAEKIGKDG